MVVCATLRAPALLRSSHALNHALVRWLRLADHLPAITIFPPPFATRS